MRQNSRASEDGGEVMALGFPVGQTHSSGICKDTNGNDARARDERRVLARKVCALRVNDHRYPGSFRSRYCLSDHSIGQNTLAVVRQNQCPTPAT